MIRAFSFLFLFFSVSLFLACHTLQDPKQFDVLIKNGTIYDGSGSEPYKADLAINGDTIAAMGDLSHDQAKKVIDATGLAVSPGFINMLSWADGSLLKDGRSMSDIKQGVTLEVFGEGWSPGPKLQATKAAPWRSLGEYFKHLEKLGVSPNFASFVGATTVRTYVIGNANRKATTQEMEKMKTLVKQAMEEGAMGLGSSLIYAPADFASTEELIELSKVASSYGGMYITHMRSESDKILPAINETLRIASEAKIPAEIYHLKINQPWNWNKIDTVIAKIDSAQKAGLKISANMYTYNASGTSLTARLPTWVQDGGAAAMRKRLTNPITRKKVLSDLALGIPSKNSDPKNVMLLGFRKDSLNKLYKAKRLDEIARIHGKNADETMLDLIVADKSSIPAIFFLISEDNVKRMLKLPYVSICSDAGSIAAEGANMNGGAHPRMYGSFARLLGKYVRDEKIMSLQEAIRRMTLLPATHLNINRRGLLKVGNYADVAVFNPENVKDQATFESPHQYAEGMMHVFVNGGQVLQYGEHTNLRAGRLIKRNKPK